MATKVTKIGTKVAVSNGSIEETFDAGKAFMSYPGTVIENKKLEAAAKAEKPASESVDDQEYTVRIDAWSTPENPRTVKAVKTAQGFRLIS